jgi:hypothetical protein
MRSIVAITQGWEVWKIRPEDKSYYLDAPTTTKLSVTALLLIFLILAFLKSRR